MIKKATKSKKSKGISLPIIQGEFANFAGVNNSELQTIIDFGFVQPVKKGEDKSGIIIRRLILPPKVAKELGQILTNSFNVKKGKTKKK